MPYFNKIEWEFLKNSKEYDLSSNHYELNISIPNCNKLKEMNNIISLDYFRVSVSMWMKLNLLENFLEVILLPNFR